MSYLRVAIIFTIFYISAVSAVINWSTFADNRYDRICTTAKSSYNPTAICKDLAKISDGAYDDLDNVTGGCTHVYVKLKNDNPYEPGSRSAALPFDVVLCQIGPNYQKCVSASTADNVVEHFDYAYGSSEYRCSHTGSMNI